VCSSDLYSENLQTDGVAARFSNDGDELAITAKPTTYATWIPDGYALPQFGPCFMQTRYTKHDSYDVLTPVPVAAPVLAFGIAWSNDDSQITLGGMCSPTTADAIVYTRAKGGHKKK
jgi:hypothetical protein